MATSNSLQAATVARVATSTSVATLLAAVGRRSVVLISNESGANLFVKLGTAASTTDYSVKIAAGGYWEMPATSYGGAITGILDAGTGNAQVTSY